MKNKLFTAALGLLLSSLVSTASAEPGVTATEIKIGMANAQSGPTAGLGPVSYTHLTLPTTPYV